MATDIGYESGTLGNGKTIIRIYCKETLGTTTSEWSTAGIPIPRAGQIYVQSQLISGTSATTIQPLFTYASAALVDTLDFIDQVAGAAAYINEMGAPLPYSFRSANTAEAQQPSIIYCKHKPDASPSSDVVVRTKLTIIEL